MCTRAGSGHFCLTAPASAASVLESDPAGAPGSVTSESVAADTPSTPPELEAQPEPPVGSKRKFVGDPVDERTN